MRFNGPSTFTRAANVKSLLPLNKITISADILLVELAFKIDIIILILASGPANPKYFY